MAEYLCDRILMCQGSASVTISQQSGGVIRMKSILGILLLLANAGSVLARDTQTGYAAQPAARDAKFRVSPHVRFSEGRLVDRVLP